MKYYQIYLGGNFLKTKNVLEVKNPYNNETFAQTYLAGKPELETAIAKAKSVEEELKHLPAFKRYEILMQIAAEINNKKNYLAEVLCKESGKPIKYSLGEINRSIQTFTVAAEESKRFPKEYISIDWTSAGKGKEGIIKYFPIGLIAGISPFNFPMNLAVHKIAPAIAAGCPIIIKPSSSTPLSTLELAKIIDKTELPKGAVSILPMDRKTGNLLVTDERIKLLTFTGSPEVGWKMKQNAGKKKIVLELGGNAGAIICSSTNIENAVKKCLVGGFAYSGQVCIHTQRIYVDDKVFNDFAEKLINDVRKLKVGNPLKQETDISVMIDEENAVRVENWIAEAVGNRAEILCGGKRKGSFYEPTVLTNTNNYMKVCSQEVFGPVVTLEKFTDFKKATDEINNSKYGLQAGVFTNQIDQMNFAFDKLNVGGVIINDVPTFRVDHMPYGGTKDSGLGREGVKYTIKSMMEAKILIKDS